MIAPLLSRWLGRAPVDNPARVLAMMGHRQHRAAVKAKARELRAQLGLQPLPILDHEGD